jgi:hypothetical protein
MTTTATHPSAGEQRILATYRCDDGVLRQLVSQRLKGRVFLSDIPAGDDGHVYLVERNLGSPAEVDPLVDDYIAKAELLGRCPMADADWWSK